MMSAMSAPIPKPKNFFLAAAPLFLVIFIDSMGLGLVFPILNALVFDPNAHFITANISTSTQNLLYGFTMAIYMFCWFFGAAFLGNLSDQVGRKKSLMICLIGAIFGYLFSALAVVVGSYTLLLAGRVIAGFTAGSQAIAQAVIVDLSQPEHKSRNLGFILFFSSLGFVFGPVIGGILSSTTLVHWFSYAMPFYFAASISLLNAILLFFLFEESFTHAKNKVIFKLHYALEIFISAFKHEKIRELSIILLVMMFGWSGFYTFISMYMLKVYHFTPLQNGFYMGVLGIGFGVGSGFLVEPAIKYFSLKQCVIMSSVLVAFATLLTITAPSEIFVWFYVLLVGIAIAIAYSTILNLFSNEVDADSQGWIMGITGAIMAFAFGLNGLLVGFLAYLSAATPLIISALSFVTAAILMKSIFKNGSVLQAS